MFCETHNFDDQNCSFDELNIDFTIQEIIETVKKLKCDKAAGKDCMLNSYFMHPIDIIAPTYVTYLMQFLTLVFIPIPGLRELLCLYTKKGIETMLVIIEG